MVIAPPTEVLAVSGAARPTLAAALAGRVIEAKLTLALADGLFRFSSPEGEIDLPLPRSLPPGTQVRIAPQPDGSFQVTVLNEENLPPPAMARPLPAPAPPLTTIVHPRAPIALPQGQEVAARVIANPEPGLVRVATPQGEVDLPLPRPVPLGTTLRITPEPQGAVRVSVPEIPTRAQPAEAAPQKPVVHPTVFTSKPDTVPVNIPLGRVVEARVLPAPEQGTSQGMVRFAAPEGEFELPLPRAFPPGTQARLVAQPNGSVVVTMRPEPPQQPGLQAAPQSSPNPPATTSPAMRAVTLPPGPSIPVLPAGQVIEAEISLQPARAPGLVRIASPFGEFELPLPQHQALPPGTPLRLAPQPNGGLTVVPMAEGPEAPLALSTPRPATPAEAVRQTVRTAVLKQDGLANVFADIETLPLRTDAPQAVRRAAETLLDQRISLDDVAKPQQLAKAIAGSGIFAERMLSSLPPLQSAPPDLKLALFVLRAALGTWSRTDKLPLVPQSGLPVHSEAAPPPPMQGTPPAAQAPAAPSHMKGGQLQMQALAAEELVPHLVRDTDAALARVNLHQIASLPDDRGAQRGDAPDARWSAEIPVNIDGRTAVFGFVIERDGRQAQIEREKRRWRFRAALDLPDTGAIEADVRLQGTHVSAGIIAEEADTVALLEAALPMLRDGLTAQGFDVETLSVRRGKGTPPPAPPGYFMDRRT